MGLTGVSRTSVYTIPDFPKPIKIKGATATVQGGSRWVESEVILWMQSRIETRDTQPRSICLGLFRGRPSKAEQVEAECQGITVRALRAAGRA